MLRSLTLSGVLSLLLSTLSATPTGPTVIQGTASIRRSGSVTTITADDEGGGSIIDWTTFSIAPDEEVIFVLPTPSSRILNTVTGSKPSTIVGSLSSNGHVVLINPQGLTIGSGGKITSADLTASTLSPSTLTTLEFEGPSQGSFVNEGTIECTGNIFLSSPSITNRSTIHSTTGTVCLAAGESASFHDEHPHPVPYIKWGSASTTIENSGAIEGASVELRAHGHHPHAIPITHSGMIVTTSGDERSVVIYADGGSVACPGTITSHGGDIILTGAQVLLPHSARIDSSNKDGGGKIFIGGGWGGKDIQVPNADTVIVANGATIIADGTVDGSGGDVVLWADGITRFQGSISSRGAGETGNGGQAEVSAKGSLAFDGQVALDSDHGKKGTLLLDPENIYILDGPTATVTPVPQWKSTAPDGRDINQLSGTELTEMETAGNGFDSYITANGPNGLVALLTSGGGTNVTLGASGTISVTSSIEIPSGTDCGTLTLNGGIITASATIDIPGAITLNGTTSVTTSAGISSGGDVTIWSNKGAVTVTNVTGVGTVDIQASIDDGSTGNVTATGTVSSSGGEVTIWSNKGAVTVTNVTGVGTVDIQASISDGSTGDVTATGTVSSNGETVDIKSYGGAVYITDITGNGNVSLSASTQISGDSLTISSTTGDISITTPLMKASPSIGNGNVFLEAGSGIISISQSLSIDSPIVTLHGIVTPQDPTYSLSGTATTVNIGSLGSVQNGVDVASPSQAASIFLAATVYPEAVDVNAKSLSIIGESASATTIACPDTLGSFDASGTTYYPIVYAHDGATVRLKTLKVTTSASAPTDPITGVAFNGADGELTGVVLDEVVGYPFTYGVVGIGAASNMCTVTNSSISHCSNTGIFINGMSATLNGNTITEPDSSTGVTLIDNGASSNYIIGGNTFSGGAIGLSVVGALTKGPPSTGPNVVKNSPNTFTGQSLYYIDNHSPNDVWPMPLGDTIGGYVIGQETEEQFEELLLKIFDHHNDPTYGYALKFEGTTPPTPSTTVYPPSQFFGAVKHRHHPTKKKHFILRTNWTASPTEDVSFYRVYANGRVVKQIPRSKPFSYHVHRHTHRVGKKYEITAVVITDDGKEVESPRVTLKVFDSKK